MDISKQSTAYPKGKVKEVSYGYFSISKSAEEQYKLLFTNFY